MCEERDESENYKMKKKIAHSRNVLRSNGHKRISFGKFVRSSIYFKYVLQYNCYAILDGVFC